MNRICFARLTCIVLSITLLCASTCGAGTVGRIDMDTLKTRTYTVEGDAFVRHNGDRFSNRPLYNSHIFAVVLGGDKPYLFFGNGPTADGCLMLAFKRRDGAKWLFDASDITSQYRPDRMEWAIRDDSWGATTLTLEAVPVAIGPGMVVKLHCTGEQPGDQIIFASGGACHLRESILFAYDMTTIGREDRLQRGFVPKDCSGNIVSVNDGKWTLEPPAGKSQFITTGACSGESHLSVVDADAWTQPLGLKSDSAAKLPMIRGTIDLQPGKDIFWSVRSSSETGTNSLINPQVDFEKGMERARTIQNQVIVTTPDEDLNAAVGASTAVMDAVFRDGMYTHSGMRWGVPLLGWRTTFGATTYGWHENVKAEAERCIAKQVTDSDKTSPEANPATLLSSQSNNSMMFGKGRVNLYQPAHYDMQSQFFDQLIDAWRWTGDPELEQILRPALSLHLQYIKNCFDPSNIGIYESYANSWPTDDQWYNGGGTSEETAYAFAAQEGMANMARWAGEKEQSETFHKQAEETSRHFHELLWDREAGHPGAYREQGGYKRLHDSCWLYSIFCPIDAGLLNHKEAAESLQYTETSLERVKMPYGGEQCWPSNWVPSIWSLREMWPGDNYHLALAYFQTGLADGGWNLLKGTFPQMMFYGPVPGDLGHPAGATDFNDCASMFCRSVVEGLFGIRPNYPDGRVVLAPQFPVGWEHASIKTPDVSLEFHSKGMTATYTAHLTRAAEVEFEVPVSTSNVVSVNVNGSPSHYVLIPGFGSTNLVVKVPSTNAATLDVKCSDSVAAVTSTEVEASSGDTIELHPPRGQAVDFHDPEGVLTAVKISRGSVTGTVSTNSGNHEVFVLTAVGSNHCWEIFKIHTSNPTQEKAIAAQMVLGQPFVSACDHIDMKAELNCDIRQIFQQKYLSPRPNTCSLRLATDGYSTWQMVLDPKNKVPVIDLSYVKALSNADGNLVSSRGISFAWNSGEKNIAFTSQWDNFPRQVNVAVNEKGEAAWLLVCGSTNPMECGIANAQLRFDYADGSVDKLDLVPPMNFWSLCPYGRGTDYDYKRDGFCLPKIPPETLQLGNNCRVMVLNRRLKPGVVLKSVTLESLSQQVVIGLMGVTIMNPEN